MERSRIITHRKVLTNIGYYLFLLLSNASLCTRLSRVYVLKEFTPGHGRQTYRQRTVMEVTRFSCPYVHNSRRVSKLLLEGQAQRSWHKILEEVALKAKMRPIGSVVCY